MLEDNPGIGSVTAPLHLVSDTHDEHTKRLEEIIRDTKAFKGKWQTYINGYSMRIPPEYIHLFQSGGVITAADNRKLMLFGTTHWALYQRWLTERLRRDPTNRKIRAIYRSASEFSPPDKDGMVLVDPLLANYAKLNKEVALIGMVYYFEIQSKEAYINLNYVKGSNKLMDIINRFKHNKGQ